MICAPLVENTIRKNLTISIKAAKLNYDLVELRLDYLKNIDLEQLTEFYNQCPLPVISTCRTKKDNAKYAVKNKLKLLETCAKLNSDFIDLEINYIPDKKIKYFLHNFKSNIILSYHNFNKEISLNNLNKIYNKMKKYKNTIKKIAIFCKNEKKFFAYMQFFNKIKQKEKVVFILLGKYSKISRVLFHLLGSYISYVPIDNKKISSKGQICLKDFNLILKKLQEDL